MAEYVRRKRPPADHPFWAHLSERANPPSVVWPVVVPTAVGLLIGLVAGLNDPVSLRQAVEIAGVIATALAGLLAVGIGVPVIVLIVRRSHASWTTVPTAFLAIAFIGFLAVFVPMTLLLFGYSLSGGYGPWVGMTIGAGLGVCPGILIAWGKRHRWADRIRRWPRWETMRRRHRRQTAAAQPAIQPPTRIQVGPTQPTAEETVARPQQDQPGA